MNFINEMCCATTSLCFQDQLVSIIFLLKRYACNLFIHLFKKKLFMNTHYKVCLFLQYTELTHCIINFLSINHVKFLPKSSPVYISVLHYFLIIISRLKWNSKLVKKGNLIQSFAPCRWESKMAAPTARLLL